jgi:hypothetical protein
MIIALPPFKWTKFFTCSKYTFLCVSKPCTYYCPSKIHCLINMYHWYTQQGTELFEKGRNWYQGMAACSNICRSGSYNLLHTWKDLRYESCQKEQVGLTLCLVWNIRAMVSFLTSCPYCMLACNPVISSKMQPFKFILSPTVGHHVHGGSWASMGTNINCNM